MPKNTASSPITPATPGFDRCGAELQCEGVSLESLAKRFGTPLYVYSGGRLIENYDRVASAFAGADPLIAFSVKACSNIALLRLLARRGSGFDIVSVGELERVARAGADPKRVIFAGVGKRRDEIARALEFGVGEFNIESPGEAEVIHEEARKRRVVAPVALRLNPDVDAHTHEYISTGRKENKFGINIEVAGPIIDKILSLKHLRLVGLHAHIGSQILDTTAHARATERLEDFVLSLQARGVSLETLNMGGGFGIDYEKGESPLAVERVAAKIVPVARRLGLRLCLEPGRYIVGSAGTLLTRVLYVKRGTAKTFVIVDASMTDLVRPALYAAYHRIVPVNGRVAAGKNAKLEPVDVVGPVCETGDFLARERPMPPVEPGDLLAVLDAGAYGIAMASNYNTRLRPAEALVQGRRAHLIRRRETFDDLLNLEIIPPHLADKKKTARSRRT